jgi:hypothetical protein
MVRLANSSDVRGVVFWAAAGVTSSKLRTAAAAGNSPTANAPSLGQVRCRTFIFSLRLSNGSAAMPDLSVLPR